MNARNDLSTEYGTTDDGLKQMAGKSHLISSITSIEDLDKSYLIDSSQCIILKRIFDSSRCKVHTTLWSERVAAIKTIKITKEDENKYKRLYINEVQCMYLLTKINAPNVIEFFGYEIKKVSQEGDFLPYHFNIMMEYARNGSLLKMMSDTQHRPISWSLRMELLREVALGLKHVHLNGIIHRDIKSSNIFIDINFQAKIADFGLAILEGETGYLKAGTIFYMAPESLEYNVASKMSDMFSFAVVACEIANYKKIDGLLPGDIKQYSEIGEKDNTRTMLKQYEYLMSGKRVALPEKCPPSLANCITLGWMHDPTKRPTAEQAEEMLEEGLKSMLGVVK